MLKRCSTEGCTRDAVPGSFKCDAHKANRSGAFASAAQSFNPATLGRAPPPMPAAGSAIPSAAPSLAAPQPQPGFAPSSAPNNGSAINNRPPPPIPGSVGGGPRPSLFGGASVPPPVPQQVPNLGPGSNYATALPTHAQTPYPASASASLGAPPPYPGPSGHSSIPVGSSPGPAPSSNVAPQPRPSMISVHGPLPAGLTPAPAISKPPPPVFNNGPRPSLAPQFPSNVTVTPPVSSAPAQPTLQSQASYPPAKAASPNRIEVNRTPFGGVPLAIQLPPRLVESNTPDRSPHSHAHASGVGLPPPIPSAMHRKASADSIQVTPTTSATPLSPVFVPSGPIPVSSVPAPLPVPTPLTLSTTSPASASASPPPDASPPAAFSPAEPVRRTLRAPPPRPSIIQSQEAPSSASIHGPARPGHRHRRSVSHEFTFRPEFEAASTHSIVKPTPQLSSPPPPPPAKTRERNPPQKRTSLLFSSAPNPFSGNDLFSGDMSKLIDSALCKLRDFEGNQPHPLSDLLFESLMIARETLNCWSESHLSHAAMQSISERLRQSRRAVDKEVEAAPVLAEGRIQRNGNLGWNTRRIVLKHHNLIIYKMDGPVSQQFDMRTLINIGEIHNAGLPEFCLVFTNVQGGRRASISSAISITDASGNILNGSGTGDRSSVSGPSGSSAANSTLLSAGLPTGGSIDPSQLKILHLRANTAWERQKWLNLFNLYLQQNYYQQYILSRMSIPDKIELYVNGIYKLRKSYSEKKYDFLYAITPVQPIVDANTVVAAVSGGTGTGASAMGSGLSSVFASNLLPVPISKSNSINPNIFQMRERFHVMLQKSSLSKNKPRILEVDLTRSPHRFSIYKVNSTYTINSVNFVPQKDPQASFPSNEVEGAPGFNSLASLALEAGFKQDEFLDYRLNIPKKSIELLFSLSSAASSASSAKDKEASGEKVSREFIFPSLTQLYRFVDYLFLFERLPMESQTEFIHHDLIHILYLLRQDSSMIQPGEDDNADSPAGALKREKSSEVSRSGSSSGETSNDTSSDPTREEFQTSRIYRSQLKLLIASLHRLCPNNSHAQQLYQLSEQCLGMDELSDLLRLQLLAAKFYLIEFVGHAANSNETESFSFCLCPEHSGPFPNGPDSSYGANAALSVSLSKPAPATPSVSSATMGASSNSSGSIKAEDLFSSGPFTLAPSPMANNNSNECLLLFHRAFIEQNGILILTNYLSSLNEDLRCWTLKCIYQLFILKNVIGKCQGIFTGSSGTALGQSGGVGSFTGELPANYLIAAGSTATSIKDKSGSEANLNANNLNCNNLILSTKYPLLYYIHLLAMERPISEQLVNTMFELLMGSNRMPGFAALQNAIQQKKLTGSISMDALMGTDELSTNSSNGTPPGTGSMNLSGSGGVQVLNKPIVEPALVPLCFYLLSYSTVAACVSGLQNFVLMLNSGNNSDAFFSQPGWQNWLLPLLFEPNHAPANSAHPVPRVLRDSKGDIFKLTMAIFTAVHYDKLYKDNCLNDPVAAAGAKSLKSTATVKDAALGGSQLTNHVLVQTCDCIEKLIGWNENAIQLVKTMIISLLSKIKVRARDFSGNFNYSPQNMPCWESIFSLLNLIEDYLFYRPIAFLPFYELGGRSFVERALTNPLLHVTNEGSWFDVGVPDVILDALTALQLHRSESDSLSVSKEEKQIKQRGVNEFEFWSQVKDCLTQFNKGMNPKIPTLFTEVIKRAKARS